MQSFNALKMKTKYTLLRVVSIFILILFGHTSCSNDFSDVGLDQENGTIQFHFLKISTWGINSLDEIKTVKITLERQGEMQNLPSLSLSGSIDSLSTELYSLPQGVYSVVAYKAFAKNASLLLDVELDENNLFEIKTGEATNFVMPIKIKEIISTSNIKNSLFAICKEAFGPDSIGWPATWRESNPLQNWENIEFEYDQYDNISAVVGLTLDHQFAPLKRLPSSVVNILTLEQLTIRDNAVEELPENIGESYIVDLKIINTKLSKFPKSMENLDLHSILLKGNNIVDFPEFICAQKNLNTLQIYNEAISSIPESIKNVTGLTSLVLRDLKLDKLPNVFDKLFKISTLDIAGNPNITSLPSTIKESVFGNQSSYLRAVFAQRCGFTELPEALISSKFVSINLADNKITEIKKSDLESMTSLSDFMLDRNPLTVFPQVNSSSIMLLSLIDCGLNESDVDCSGLTSLNDRYLFFTQEKYDEVFAGYMPAIFK